ncbi:MAG: tripartite tricarboxylate transporter substrate binding protein [Lacisediminimonas sp.]|nr:tripartite tricarboxylate transporter substrate binding protein [Lacisediminimonas sp.]
MTISRRELLGAAGALCTTFVLPARAQTWPDRAIKVLLGYATGGSTDATARILSRPLEQRLKQPVVVDYKPGAGASIGADLVAKSTPDGYTIGLTDTGPMCIMPNLRKVPYNPITDFTPLSYVCSTGLAVLVHPSVEARNIKELIALLKARPGRLSYASSGVGSVHHLAGELFKANTKTFMVHIPYRGAGPALLDLTGGQIPVMFATIGPSLPLIASGKVRALAVTTTKRSSVLPDVPTLIESGLADYEAVLRFMMVAPSRTPEPVASRLQSELRHIVADPAVIKELERLGNDEIENRSPADIQALIKSDLAKWGKVIRDAKITLEG